MFTSLMSKERKRKEEKQSVGAFIVVFRRFTEFYVLEMKLIEFHGDSLRFTMLPPKKVVKKMPGRLSREKGQHLRPFLLTILANTLYSPEKVDLREKFEVSDLSSLSSLSISGENYQSTFHNPLFGNNCFGCKISEVYDYNKTNWTRSFMDSMSLLFFTFVSHTSQWTLNIHSALRMLCRDTIDNLMTLLLKKACWMVFSEQNLIVIIRLIQKAIFCSDGSLPSEQEKILREELATRLALEFAQDELNRLCSDIFIWRSNNNIYLFYMPSHVLRAIGSKNWRNGVKKLVNILQYPRLNKHLSYVILDLLIAKIFPDEFS
ncbi:sorting nexin [Dictyocaulus viviparus]|uniref:Sorting nexin n=1 Tax=Dictyocaulus viviparus TaxID=29172 RepID=A0A0D8Y3F9_DICVI|nr:sorting nexin [Dictyocaulus viviparus]